MLHVGFLGYPDSLNERRMAGPVVWTSDNLTRLRTLGFDTLQLNVAWGARPGDEPLNLEDVVALSAEDAARYPQSVPLRGTSGSAAWDKRRGDLRARLALARAQGWRTIFHFGAPYNAHCRYGDAPPNCLSDPDVTERYERLLDAFAAEFPGVDDLLVYTYDQDAWLCSEFGPCPRCLGKPLAERVAPFLNRLAARWRTLSPAGRIWWEPWELSAGQVYDTLTRLDAATLGLALHVNVAEVMATLPVDRWLKNTLTLAKQRELPAIVEYWLGGPSEELETFYHLQHPLVTWRGLQAIKAQRPDGIKEYFGLDPTVYDANLAATAYFFAHSDADEDALLAHLAEPWGTAGGAMIAFWRACSQAMELFPWDASWYIRQIGRSRTDHALTAAFVRGQQCHTPSWDSTRRAIFMKTDNAQPDAWLLEDLQLRCQHAAAAWQTALDCAPSVESAPESLRGALTATLADTAGIRRRALAYTYHLRETNLATLLRAAAAQGWTYPASSLAELAEVMAADAANHGERWPEMDAARARLAADPAVFLAEYFQPCEDAMSKGLFSATSR